MSEERFCELCHIQVWFGAYGTTIPHVDFNTQDEYDARKKICEDCIHRLNNLPLKRKEEY